VPGLRLELVTALIRSLPKAVRRSFVPAPDHAKALVATLHPDGRSLTDAMASALRARTGVDVPVDAWDRSRVPDHLRLTFRVEDEQGRTLAEGKDLAALQRALRPAVAETVAQAAADIEARGLRQWSFGELPATFTRSVEGHEVRGWPALVDEGDSVAVRVLGDEAEARRATWRGTRRLLLLTVPSPLVGVVQRLDNATKLALGANPHGGVPALLDDCLACAVDALMTEAGAPVRDGVGFDRLREHVRGQLPDTLLAIVRQVAEVLTIAREVEARVTGTANPALLPAMVDVRAQVAGLVHRGFVTETGRDRLPDLRRYLSAAARRLDTLGTRPERDRGLMAQVQAVTAEYDAWRRALPESRRDDPAVQAVRWMIEELRVSLFAQTLGTPTPVSDKRIRRAMAQAG